MKEAQRIGILGGTFNPIHNGHLIIAQSAMEVFDLTSVLFIPCDIPPHRKNAAPIDSEHRIAMIQEAIEDNLFFEMNDMEIRRGGTSYAIDTISELKKQYPESELFFIIGTDTLLELHTWHRIYDLLDLCSFVTICRPGFDVSEISPDKLNLSSPWPERLLDNVAAGHSLDVSSSDIRHRNAEGMSIKYLVPDPVAMYIGEHGLYGG